MDVFKELTERLNKSLKGTVQVSKLSESRIASDYEWIKTPAYDLNRILSGSLEKGLPNKTLTAIVGPEHTMKSSFMILVMAEAQKMGYVPIIIDTEGAITRDFCIRWGLNPDKAIYIPTPWIDDIVKSIAQLKYVEKKKGKKKETKVIDIDIKDENEDEEDEEDIIKPVIDNTKYIIGIDSIGGIEKKKFLEDSLGDGPKADQGALQKEIRRMLKLLLHVCISQDSLGIVTGHLYGSPGLIPMPDQMGGGKAMRLFPSIIINLKKHLLKSGDDIIGNQITATTIKNRFYPPFQVATVNIDYTEGINSYAGLLELGIEAKIIVKEKNSYLDFETKEKIGVGASKATLGLKDHPEIINKINEWLKTTGYSTVNREVEQAESLLEEVEASGGTTEVEEPPKKRTISRKK